MDQFDWKRYTNLVASLLPPVGKSSGYSEAAVTKADRRLGVRLPTLLKEFYLQVGKRGDINADFHRLVLPEDLYVDDEGVLVFYDENQEACHWGVKASHANDYDPPVVRWIHGNGASWTHEFNRLSDFILDMLFLQASNTMRYSGVGNMPASSVKALGEGWQTREAAGTWTSRAIYREGELIYILGGDDPLDIFAGAKTKRQFLALEKALKISFDYCTLDDE